MKTHTFITCPICGHKEELTRPLLYHELLINEEHFTYTCPMCKHKRIIETPTIIYYKKHLIAFDPEGYHLSFIIDYLNQEDISSVRLTATLSSFVEKQLILKNNYNDIAIEAYKHSLRFMMHKNPVLFYNDEPVDTLINMSVDPVESYLLSKTHYEKMVNNPLIHKLIKYDTPLAVDKHYIEKLSTRRITTANISFNSQIISAILPCFLDASVGDIALFEKNGSLHSGIILSFKEEDVFNISSSIKIKQIFTDDYDEEFLRSLKHVHDYQENFDELISLMCDLYVYIPFENNKPYYMTISPETCLPVFTKKESIHECFPLASRIIKTKLITLLYLTIFKCDGFLFNPQMDSIFFANHSFLDILKDHLNTSLSQNDCSSIL